MDGWMDQFRVCSVFTLGVKTVLCYFVVNGLVDSVEWHVLSH